MKIALIVFRIGPSHGSILQTYALYQTLQRMGHEVTILDRQRHFSVYRMLRSVLGRIKGSILKTYNGPIFYFKEYPDTTMKELCHFVQKELSSNTITFNKKSKLDAIVQQGYDCYIVGSDQTWRPKYVEDIKYYFLDFLSPDSLVKRIAYAPSFGTDEWEYSLKLTEECKTLLSRFSAISVREDDGVALCKKYFNAQATHVLDPTLLLSREEYISLIEKTYTESNQILAFSILDKSELATKIIQKVSAELDVKLYQINASHNCTASGWIEPSIDKWLGGIYNSKFVVTDSFHATVFAIIFNKPFITIINSARGSSRIKSLLSMFGLENRMVNSLDQISDHLLFSPIDWKTINQIIAVEKDRSINWLKEVLK